jgi:hypothetical protein
MHKSKNARTCFTSELTSRDGLNFDPNSYRWRLSRDATVSLSWIDNYLAEPARGGFISALAHLAQNYSAGYTTFMCDRTRAFLSFVISDSTPIAVVTTSMLISYRSSLNKKTEYQLGSLKGFLGHWVERQCAGIDSDVGALLASWRFRGCEKGRAIQMRCPHQGALSPFEYEALQSKLLDAFANEEISLADFVLVTLFSATGRRPSQISDLKAKDLLMAHSTDGIEEYFLNVPRRKQRGLGWRAEFKPVRLTPEIGRAVSTLIESNEKLFCECSRSTILQKSFFRFFQSGKR